MTALTISPAQRKSLKAQAHDLNPVVMVGGDGLTPAVIKEAKSAIQHHGLIKIRVFGDDREARIAIYEELCDKLDAAPVQHIGKLLSQRNNPEFKNEDNAEAIRQVSIASRLSNGEAPPAKRVRP